MLHIKKASEQDEAAVITLLTNCNLPTQDLAPAHQVNFLLLKDEDRLIGCAGLEIYGQKALLRSVAIDQSYRGDGLGKRLVAETESLASTNGVRSLYLLTPTAEPFFASLGFHSIDRDTAPPAIQQTAEFQSLCPSSAVCMVKELNRVVSRET